MKYWVLLMALSLGLTNDIARINKHKSEAQKNYLNGDYENAIGHYQILVDSFAIQEPEVLMNYANAAFLLTNTSDLLSAKITEEDIQRRQDLGAEKLEQFIILAQEQYTHLSQTAEQGIKSLAYNQLGVMAYNDAEFSEMFISANSEQSDKLQLLKQAKELFKSALKSDPSNERARFNYELVSKELEEEQQKQDQEQDQDQQEQEQQEQEQQEQDQQEQEQQEQEQQQEQQGGEDQPQEEQQGDSPEDSEQQEGDPQDSEQENPQEGEQQEQEQSPQSNQPQEIQEGEISEEKAKMILEAMKNAEIQYIQQNKRKAAKRPPSGKPDW